MKKHQSLIVIALICFAVVLLVLIVFVRLQ